MAALLPWHKKLPPELSDFRDREIIWAWFVVSNNRPLNNELFNNSESRAEHLIAELARPGAMPDFAELRRMRAQFCPEKSDISWIDSKDERLLNWLLWRMQSRNEFIGGYNFPNKMHLDLYNFVVYMIDYSSTGLPDKLSALGEFRRDWSVIKAQDKFLKGWLDNKDEDQCAWLFEYCSKNNLRYASLRSSVRLASAVSAYEKQLYFLLQLDCSGLDDVSKRLLVQDLKRKWSRKVRSSKNDIVQLNLEVSAQIRDDIKRMAKEAGVPTAKFLEQLISKEKAFRQ